MCVCVCVCVNVLRKCVPRPEPTANTYVNTCVVACQANVNSLSPRNIQAKASKPFWQ